nr:hypothetical protein [uncultured Methanospirillum sp.]
MSAVLVSAGSPLNGTDLQGNGSPGDTSEFSGSSSMNITLNQVSAGVIPNETSVIGTKSPRSNLTFSSIMNSTSNITGTNTSSDQVSEGQENQSSNLSANASLSKYDSLGDIIRAKDWKALGEYQCKIKAENSASLAESGINNGDQESKWNSYFNYREPVAVSYPCCG